MIENNLPEEENSTFYIQHGANGEKKKVYLNVPQLISDNNCLKNHPTAKKKSLADDPDFASRNPYRVTHNP